ncbi:MAG: hypothetical protein H0W64_09930 [Gammaproteobacteria bacterium]|nr:hypothetical protein [Gammaproteobacteria bacterium]
MDDKHCFKSIIGRVLLVFLISLSLIKTAEARSFIFVNNCSYPVWFGLVGGANTPKPANGNYQLPPGGRNTATIPAGTWSGVIAGRTNCATGRCETGDCGGSNTGPCTRGFQPPTTQAEFTVRSNDTDYYDVSVINGINMGVSVTPSIGSKASLPYFCGSPGSGTPSAGLAGCSWKFTPPLVEYNWVAYGGKACTANGDCASGTQCGLGFDPVLNGFKKTCGRQLGYWTANQVCGVQRSFGAPFYCSAAIPQGGILWNLMACNGNSGAQRSCYTAGASATCCGCVNWDKIGVPVPPGPITAQCVNSNPVWVDRVRPTLDWLKRACPTAYTYPYDDHSSTFICKSPTAANTVDYTITFCPTGGVNPPLPDGKCLPPANIKSTYTANKKQVTLTWDKPANAETISTYQVNDWLDRQIWRGVERTFIDKSLPGTNGKFTYFLYSNCPSGRSPRVQYDVVIK